MNKRLWQIYVEQADPNGLVIAPAGATVYEDEDEAIEKAAELNQAAREQAESLFDEPLIIDTYYAQEVVLWQHFS